MEDTINFPRGGSTTGTTAASNATGSSTTTGSKGKNHSHGSGSGVTTTTTNNNNKKKDGDPKKRKMINDDVLFGKSTSILPITEQEGYNNNSNNNNSSKHKKKKNNSPNDSNHHHHHNSSSKSLLPMGGGGCTVLLKTVSTKHKKHQPNSIIHTNINDTTTTTTTIKIDVLDSTIMSMMGVQLLGIIKQLNDHVMIVSLPNLWNAYMLRNPTAQSSSFTGTTSNSNSNSSTKSASLPPLTKMFELYQIIPVTIINVTMEHTKTSSSSSSSSSKMKRKIEVSCLPQYINPSITSILQYLTITDNKSLPMSMTTTTSTSTGSTNNHNHHHNTSSSNMTSGMKVRAIIVSFQDHGIVLNLGHMGYTGFLLYTDIHVPYCINNHEQEHEHANNGFKVNNRKSNITTTTTTTTTTNVLQLHIHRFIECVVKPNYTTTTSTSGSGSSSGTSSTTTGIIPLCIPTNLHYVTYPFSSSSSSSTTTTLADMIPGTCIKNIMVEQCATNGLAISFGPYHIYRGAIDTSHIPGTYLLSYDMNYKSSNTTMTTTTTTKQKYTWQDYYLIHQRIIPYARIIALDTVTKVLRLSILPHLLVYNNNNCCYNISDRIHSIVNNDKNNNNNDNDNNDDNAGTVTVGTKVPNCTVVRVDPNIGAVLAFPSEYNYNNDPLITDNDNDDDTTNKKNKTKSNQKKKPLSMAETAHLEASQVRVVYVPISKAMDADDDDKMTLTEQKSKMTTTYNRTTMDNAKSKFMKQFSIGTHHTVRMIQSNEYMMDHILWTGGTSSNIVTAHVLSHTDLIPGQIYRQVPILSHIRNTNSNNNNNNNNDAISLLIDFGLGVHGLIPALHLFDANSNSNINTSVSTDHRRKVIETKYGIGTKIDVRVLSIDPVHNKCFCTSKKMFVKASMDQMITSYDNIYNRIGQIVMGYISKIDAKKGLCITFCNNVFGRVPIRSIQMELGIDDITENYTCGTVVLCRIVHVKQRRSNNNKQHRSLWLNRNEDDDHDDADMYITDTNKHNDETDNKRNIYNEITLSLHVDGPDTAVDSAKVIDGKDGSIVNGTTSLNDNAFGSKALLSVGMVLPLNSIRVVELVSGKENGRKNGYVPGYAIISIKSKYLVDEHQTDVVVTSALPPFIECKLPYDQLLDTYPVDKVQSVEQMDAMAAEMLTIGKKINRKGLLLSDPKKSHYEYTNGVGAFAVISIRPTFISIVEQRKRKKIEVINESMGDDVEEVVTLPGPQSHFHVGGLVIGYVATLDERHGAFIRFLDGMTGLVPKTQHGLQLQLYSTVTVTVVAVDDKFNPPKVLLGIAKHNAIDKEDEVDIKQTDNNNSKRPPLKEGDIVADVVMDKIDFHRATVKILGDRMDGFEETVKVQLHCTMVQHMTAKTKPRKKKQSSDDCTEQKITRHHPFFKWKVGDKLSNLKVVSVDRRGKYWIVELTDRNHDDVARMVRTVEELNTGVKVSGIISGISTHKGLWMELSPSITAHVPALELSTDVNVLNNLESHFPIGSRLECVVLNKSVWETNRRKYYKMKSKEESKSKIPFLSLLGFDDTQSSKSQEKPEIGALVVGRIDRTLPSLAAPDLMIDLRSGYIGRCCITELVETDDWSNLPLGRFRRNSEKLHSQTEDDMQDDVLEDNAGEQKVRTEKEQFGHGTFVKCRVLARVQSKPIVEVSLRQSRLEGDFEDDTVPEIGNTVQAFVVETSKKGCFLRLSRQIEGRTILKELCVGFLPDPAASFPTGRLVVGKIKSIRDGKRINGVAKILADIDMRESIVMDDVQRKTRFDDLEIGNKYRASVMRIEDYGVFVKLENCDVSGLVHKSECSDKFIKNLSDLYDPGDVVKVVVLKKDVEKKHVGFGMKASYFEGDDDTDDEDESNDDDVDNELDDDDPMLLDEEIDSDDENYVSKLSAKMNALEDEELEGSDDQRNDDDDEQDDEDDEEEDDDDNDEDDNDNNGKGKVPQLDTNVGFDWSGGYGKSQTTTEVSDDDSSGSSEDDDENTKGKSQKARQKQAQRQKDEQEISRREIALADGTADANPESAADFERMLAGDPNSSELWIRYMAFYLTMANIPAARSVANRAFDRIEFRQEKEKLNVWCALLTLELKYGTDATMQAELDRACQHNNPKHVYLRVCEMMVRHHASNSTSGNVSKTDATFVKMCSKFRSKKTVWIAYLSYLLEQDRYNEAQKVIQRALLSLQTYKHVETLSKYAILAFTHDQVNTARTVFDGLLTKHPKRLDLFFVYTDQEIKNGNITTARSLFQRVASRGNKDIAGRKTAATNDEILLALKFNDKQMKRLFKKWYTFEEAHGNDASQERVKDAARAYVESSLQ